MLQLKYSFYFIEFQNQKFNGPNCNMRVSIIPGDFDLLMGELNSITAHNVNFEPDANSAPTAAPQVAEKPQRGKKGGKKGGK